MEQMKLADRVWWRVVQIVQESMLQGIDCADLLRQVRVVPDESDPNVLTLSPEYEQQVRDMHEKMLKHVEDLRQTGKGMIID